MRRSSILTHASTELRWLTTLPTHVLSLLPFPASTALPSAKTAAASSCDELSIFHHCCKGSDNRSRQAGVSSLRSGRLTDSSVFWRRLHNHSDRISIYSLEMTTCITRTRSRPSCERVRHVPIACRWPEDCTDDNMMVESPIEHHHRIGLGSQASCSIHSRHECIALSVSGSDVTCHADSTKAAHSRASLRMW